MHNPFRKHRVRRRPNTHVSDAAAGSTLVVPRVALVQAMARAAYDGNEEAYGAASRLLRAVDESPYDFLAV